MASLPIPLRPAAGHEGDGSNNTGGGDGGGGFVNPSTFLRPRGQSQPMPGPGRESAVDRDQRIGLVSAFFCHCRWAGVEMECTPVLLSWFLSSKRNMKFEMDDGVEADMVIICGGCSNG